MIRACLLGIAAAVAGPAAAAGIAAPIGLQNDVVFDAYTPLSSSGEMERRVLSPMLAAQIQQAVAVGRVHVREQSVDLASERFAVYVPPTMPEKGFGLLVFVSPWNEAAVPSPWISQLDKHGIIYVTAANSGNSNKVLDRREPLALLAAYNIMQRYHVDPSRVYIGGFSGGSRVALRLALAYPDLFRGALLDAGSDPIGDAQVHLPPANLMRRFQESSRLIFMTGANDNENLDLDERSRRSLRGWCVSGIVTLNVPFTRHELASVETFAKALEAVETPVVPDTERLAVCRAKYEGELDALLRRIEALQAQGKTAETLTLARKIDERFGGLAAPAQH